MFVNARETCAGFVETMGVRMEGLTLTTAWRPATTSPSSVMEPAPVRRQEVHIQSLCQHAIKAHVQLLIISHPSYDLVNPKTEEPVCKCPRSIMAVCGKNNKTYWNECMARCDGAEVGCGGRCPCPEPTVEPEVRDLWQRLMAYITSMWGTPRTDTGTVKMIWIVSWKRLSVQQSKVLKLRAHKCQNTEIFIWLFNLSSW